MYKVSVLPSEISLNKFLLKVGKEHVQDKRKHYHKATKKVEKLNQKTVVRKQIKLKIHSKAISVIITYIAALISLKIYKYFSFVIVEIKGNAVLGRLLHFILLK